MATDGAFDMMGAVGLIGRYRPPRAECKNAAPVAQSGAPHRSAREAGFPGCRSCQHPRTNADERSGKDGLWFMAGSFRYSHQRWLAPLSRHDVNRSRRVMQWLPAGLDMDQVAPLPRRMVREWLWLSLRARAVLRWLKSGFIFGQANGRSMNRAQTKRACALRASALNC